MSESIGTYLNKEVNILDVGNTKINPATEEGIQDVVTAIENITIPPATVGGATEVKQDSLETLTQALYELIERLTFLTSIRGTSADIRVTPLTTPNMSTLTTVTTVGTVTTMSNQTSVGGYLANPQIPALMNNTAIQSNISNIIIS